MVSTTKDINTMSVEELKKLDLPSEVITGIIEQRKRSPFKSLEELFEIPSMNEEILALIKRKRVDALYIEPREPLVFFNNENLPLLKHTKKGQIILKQESEQQPQRTIPRVVVVERRSRHVERVDEDGNPVIETYTELIPIYCAIVWILIGRNVNGQDRGSSGLSEGAEGRDAIQIPTQDAINDGAQQMREANSIFSQCDFQMTLCAVYVLDTNQVTVPGTNDTLAESLFNENGVLYSDTDPSPTEKLYETLGERFHRLFHEDCIHIFFTNDVQRSPDEPDSDMREIHGVGGYATERARTRNRQRTPIAIVENSGNTIAHEVGHGLGLPHVEEDDDFNPDQDDQNLMREHPTGTRLKPSQCTRMNAFASEHLREGCP